MTRRACCPRCGVASAWVHSRYGRRLAEVAFGGRPVRIQLSVRRLYCENPACPKVTFAEQVEGLTRRYQRRTPVLQRLVEQVGILLAGRGGARLLGLLGASLSRTSVLFHLDAHVLVAGHDARGAARGRLRAVRRRLSSTEPPACRSRSGKAGTRRRSRHGCAGTRCPCRVP
ncbi:transposase family protein (plasmid) [Streptomyces sp. NBC_00467]